MSFQLALQMKIVYQSFPCSSSVLILQQRVMKDVILFILYLRTRTQTYVYDLSLSHYLSHKDTPRRPGEGKSFSFHWQSGTDDENHAVAL